VSCKDTPPFKWANNVLFRIAGCVLGEEGKKTNKCSNAQKIEIRKCAQGWSKKQTEKVDATYV